MGVSFNKPNFNPSTQLPSNPVQPAAAAPAQAAPKPSFLKSGAASIASFKEFDAAAEIAAQEAKKAWRYFLKVGETASVTFLDGDLIDGELAPPSWHEHMLKIGKDWENFVCVGEHEPCPICATGEQYSWVSAFSVIDHRQYTVQQGPNAGKVYANQVKLFIAKRQTFKRLSLIAMKKGGLRGAHIELTRSGDKAPGVGDMFEYQGTYTPEQLIQNFGDVKPLNYEQEITYRTAAELVKLGIGKAITGPGIGMSAPSINTAALAEKI